MSVDVMIVGSARAIAADPTVETMELLDTVFNEYAIRYGYVELDDDHVETLRSRPSDPVVVMLLDEVDSLRSRGVTGLYSVEMMISG